MFIWNMATVQRTAATYHKLQVRFLQDWADRYNATLSRCTLHLWTI